MCVLRVEDGMPHSSAATRIAISYTITAAFDAVFIISCFNVVVNEKQNYIKSSEKKVNWLSVT